MDEIKLVLSKIRLLGIHLRLRKCRRLYGAFYDKQKQYKTLSLQIKFRLLKQTCLNGVSRKVLFEFILRSYV